MPCRRCRCRRLVHRDGSAACRSRHLNPVVAGGDHVVAGDAGGDGEDVANLDSEAEPPPARVAVS